MKRRDAFELYRDYLIANEGLATSTGLSSLLDNNLKHDYISDSLGQEGLDKKAFWKEVKLFGAQLRFGSIIKYLICCNVVHNNVPSF